MIPGLGSSPGKGIGYPLQYSWASLVAQLVKESACNGGDLSSIPGLGRSPGKGKSYPLQYSDLENCIVHGVAKSWTRLSNFHSLTHYIQRKGPEFQSLLYFSSNQPGPHSQLFNNALKYSPLFAVSIFLTSSSKLAPVLSSLMQCLTAWLKNIMEPCSRNC